MYAPPRLNMFKVKLVQLLFSAIAIPGVSSLVIAPSLISALAPQMGAVANAAPVRGIQWTPNPSRGSAGGTLSGGRRGQEAMCEAANGNPATLVTLLVPKNHAGLLTTTDRPLFSWYVDAQQPTRMKFVLQDENIAEPVFIKTLEASRSGLVSLEMPANQTLKPGTKYRWSVFLVCQNGQGAEVFARSFIERVPTRQPYASKSPLEQASTSAKNGVWYDAIAPLIHAYQQNPRNSTIKAELKSLLKQANAPLNQKSCLTKVIEKL
jgi:Domain of Unknown Function (DUF928)